MIRRGLKRAIVTFESFALKIDGFIGGAEIVEAVGVGGPDPEKRVVVRYRLLEAAGALHDPGAGFKGVGIARIKRQGAVVEPERRRVVSFVRVNQPAEIACKQVAERRLGMSHQAGQGAVGVLGAKIGERLLQDVLDAGLGPPAMPGVFESGPFHRSSSLCFAGTK